jgi:hypothetical protein
VGLFLFKEHDMTEKFTAKHKLNLANFYIAMIVSGLIGAGSGSFIVFFIALAICLGMAYHSGGIRS